MRVSVSAAQADAFYTEVLREGVVWGVKDAGGFPAPLGADGVRAMPFWSLRSRAERILEAVPAYAEFEPVEIPLADWRTRWLPDLGSKGARIGLNWSGMKATGYDIEPDAVEQALASRETPHP